MSPLKPDDAVDEDDDDAGAVGDSAESRGRRAVRYTSDSVMALLNRTGGLLTFAPRRRGGGRAAYVPAGRLDTENTVITSTSSASSASEESGVPFESAAAADPSGRLGAARRSA